MSPRPASAVIIGNRADEHVEAVRERLDADRLVLFDASTLQADSYLLRGGVLELRDLRLSTATPIRGWIRRLAPPDWLRGVVVESHEAAVKAAWLSLLASISRTCGVVWLTELGPLLIAENKLVQAEAAERLGIATPETLVTNDVAALRAALGDEFLFKPLGPGHFYIGDEALVVYSTVLRHDSPELEALGAAPFIAQRKIAAEQHIRVVTVRDGFWAAGIHAADWPVDWREAADAHSAFSPVRPPAEISEGAMALANELNLGYSSQDWLVARDACFIVDVNPAGQWLFLPDPIAGSVADAIAAWLGLGKS